MESTGLKYKTKIGLYWKFFEQISNYGMQFLIGIVMARLLSPSDFGTAALPAVFLAIAQVFIDSGFALALIRKDEVTESDLSTLFYYSVGIGLLMYVVMFLSAPSIALFYETPILTPLIRVTALTFLLNPLITPQTVILNRKLDFKTPARISIVNKLVSGLIGIIIAYLGYGVWALVIATITSSFMGLVQTWASVKWLPRERFSKVSFNYLWNFGNKMVCVGLLRTLHANIVPILLGKFSGTAQLGIYNRSMQFASLPSANFTNVLNTVTFPVLSKLQDDKDKFADNYRRMIKVSSFVVFPIMLMMCALSKPLILFLITDKWIECVLVLQIMCFTYMFQPVQILNVNLLQILGRTDLSLKLELIKKCIFPVMIIVAVQYGLVVLCVVDFIVTMFALVFNTYYTGKLINVGYFKQIKDLMPSLLLSLAMMGVVFLATYYIEESNFLKLLIGGVTGMSFYLVSAYLLRFEELKDVKYMLIRGK